MERLSSQVLKIKRDKLIKEAKKKSGVDEDDISLLNPLEKRRMMYRKKVQVSKNKSSMIQNIELFRQRLKRIKRTNDEDHWTNTKLKFHIDSVNAFALSTVKNKVDEKTLNSQFQQLSGTN